MKATAELQVVPLGDGVSVRQEITQVVRLLQAYDFLIETHASGTNIEGELDEILAGRRTVAEGVRTTKAAVTLSSIAGVELPIAQEVGNVLFDGKDLRQAISDLMERELKPEHWE